MVVAVMFALAPLFVPIPMAGFGLFTGILQAFIFTSLARSTLLPAWRPPIQVKIRQRIERIQRVVKTFAIRYFKENIHGKFGSADINHRCDHYCCWGQHRLGQAIPALVEGRAAVKALEGIARQPEAAGNLRTTLLIRWRCWNLQQFMCCLSS